MYRRLRRLRALVGALRDRTLLLARESIDNLFPVESPILDEDLPGETPADDYASQVNSRHVALQRIRINRGTLRIRVQLDSQALNEIVVGVVPSQQKHSLCRQARLDAGFVHDDDFGRRDFFYLGLKESLHLPGLDSIHNVGPQPIFNRVPHLRVPMNERDMSTVAI